MSHASLPVTVRTSVRASLLLALLGLIAWATGAHFIFPSLGPSAFVMVFPQKETPGARHVIGGHLWGAVLGLLAYQILAPGVVLAELHQPLTLDGLRLTLSAALAMLLTSAAMLGTDTYHSPACSTALIMALGLLHTLRDGLLVIGAVVVLYLAFRLDVWLEARSARAM